MPEFVLPINTEAARQSFETLDDFTRGYIEALCWTECNSDSDGLDGFGFAEMTPETVAEIVADCSAFQRDHAELLALAYARPGYDESRAGHDFWLTRNGHGVGYWDRKELESLDERWAELRRPLDTWSEDDARLVAKLRGESIGDQLTEKARAFGGVDIWRGDFLDAPPMSPAAAWEYAATWGSYITASDPGACMYGFTHTGRPQSEGHRQLVIAYLEEHCRPLVIGRPEDFDADELEKMDSFLAYIKQAPVEESH